MYTVMEIIVENTGESGCIVYETLSYHCAVEAVKAIAERNNHSFSHYYAVCGGDIRTLYFDCYGEMMSF